MLLTNLFIFYDIGIMIYEKLTTGKIEMKMQYKKKKDKKIIYIIYKFLLFASKIIDSK
jgi:hypothetical protein